MQANMFHTGVSSSKDLNPNKLATDKQIRFDLDYYENGNLCMLHVANAHRCDMTEYSAAVNFLQYLRRERTTGPDARIFIDRMAEALKDIERIRERNGGAPFEGLIPQAAGRG